MSELSLRDCESEVELARAKLARDLQVLRSPSTMSAFTDDLRREALDVKSAAIDRVKSTAENFADGLKAKAAANPAATLMIGAGIAWRLFRNPPIASLLVGAGLYSLWRTQAEPTPPGASTDYYVRLARERLAQQASDAAEIARRKAAETGELVSQQAAELMGTAADRAGQWSASAGETLQQAHASARDTAAQVLERARRGLHDATGRVEAWGESAGETLRDVRSAARDTPAKAVESAAQRLSGAGDRVDDLSATAGETWHRARSAADGVDTRDVVLRGVANVALVAAVALMYRNRVAPRAER